MRRDGPEQTVRKKVPEIWDLYLEGNESGGDGEIRKKRCDKRLQNSDQPRGDRSPSSSSLSDRKKESR